MSRNDYHLRGSRIAVVVGEGGETRTSRAADWPGPPPVTLEGGGGFEEEHRVRTFPDDSENKSRVSMDADGGWMGRDRDAWISRIRPGQGQGQGAPSCDPGGEQGAMR